MVNELDCRGLQCPLPIVRLRELIGRLPEGQEISMHVSTSQSASNVTHFLRTYFGLKVTFQPSEAGFTARFLCPDSQPTAPDLSSYACSPIQEDSDPSYALHGPVLLIASSTLGFGDDTLGGILMKGFLSTLETWNPLPHSLLLLNSGVQLADRRSGPIPTLQNLQEKGVEILVCGTCIDYYGLQTHVAVGRISNMYEISQCLSQASKILRL